MADWIWMPFGLVSGVGPVIGVLDGVHVPKGSGLFGFFFSPIGLNSVQKCIRLVCEKLTIFP